MPYTRNHVSALVDAVWRAGIDVRDRVASASPSGDATDGVGAVEAAQFEQILELCLSESGNPGLGLAMGEHASLVSLGLRQVAGSRAATLRTLIETFNTGYARSVDEHSPELSLENEQAVLTFPVHGASAGTARLRAEYGVTLGVLLLCVSAGPLATPLWVSFPHAAPSYLREYQRLFGPMLRFGAQRAAIGFSAALLRAHAYPWIRQLARASFKRFLVRMDPEPLAERVRKLLISHEGSARPEIAETAEQLGMSAGTLRRRLLAESVCFRDLWDDAQRTRALSLAHDFTYSPVTVSDALGFSEVSAFCRAFRRWTGLTLLQYRTLHRRRDASPTPLTT